MFQEKGGERWDEKGICGPSMLLRQLRFIQQISPFPYLTTPPTRRLDTVPQNPTFSSLPLIHKRKDKSTCAGCDRLIVHDAALAQHVLAEWHLYHTALEKTSRNRKDSTEIIYLSLIHI